MPAWMTSELRELVCVPKASSASRMITSRPRNARARATARPTTPAPTTTASTRSTDKVLLDEEGAESAKRGGGCEGACGSFKQQSEHRAHDRADGELACAHHGGCRAGAVREGAQRRRCSVRHDERGAAHVDRERHDDRRPVREASPRERCGGGA